MAGVSLRCTYCHDALGADAVHCAGCLAPHHAACFVEHGRCSAPGCGETRVVRRARAWRGGWPGTLVLLVNMAATLTVVFVPRMSSPIPEALPLAALSASGPCFQSDSVEALVSAGGVDVSVVLEKWSPMWFQSLWVEETEGAVQVALVEGWRNAPAISPVLRAEAVSA